MIRFMFALMLCANCYANDNILPQFEFKDSKIVTLPGVTLVDDTFSQSNSYIQDSTRVKIPSEHISFMLIYSVEENMLDKISSYNISGIAITVMFD
jgi:hypothetical protein